MDKKKFNLLKYTKVEMQVTSSDNKAADTLIHCFSEIFLFVPPLALSSIYRCALLPPPFVDTATCEKKSLYFHSVDLHIRIYLYYFYLHLFTFIVSFSVFSLGITHCLRVKVTIFC